METFTRTIFHVDMDAFFVSVEELFDPELKGKASSSAGSATSAAWFRPRPTKPASSACIPPCRCAPRPSSVPQAIFVDGHPDRYRECSEKVHEVLTSFSPQVEMASIDEAYLDMTGTERLHGPPLRAAHLLHQKMKAETQLNCSIGIGISRLIAKVSSARPSPTACCGLCPGRRPTSWRRSTCAKFPASAKSRNKTCTAWAFARSATWRASTRLSSKSVSENGGWRWPAKRAGEDAGGWFDSEVGADTDPKSISHEHTYNEDTAERRAAGIHADASLGDGGPPPARRRAARPHHPAQAALQRFHDHHARALLARAHPTRHRNLRANPACCSARTGAPAPRCGCWACRRRHSKTRPGRETCWKTAAAERWQQALSAADRLRDKFGESSVSLASGMRGGFRERTHENPVGLPGKRKPQDKHVPKVVILSGATASQREAVAQSKDP